jgi:hypothetical protein
MKIVVSVEWDYVFATAFGCRYSATGIGIGIG